MGRGYVQALLAVPLLCASLMGVETDPADGHAWGRQFSDTMTPYPQVIVTPDAEAQRASCKHECAHRGLYGKWQAWPEERCVCSDSVLLQ